MAERLSESDFEVCFTKLISLRTLKDKTVEWSIDFAPKDPKEPNIISKSHRVHEAIYGSLIELWKKHGRYLFGSKTEMSAVLTAEGVLHHLPEPPEDFEVVTSEDMIKNNRYLDRKRRLTVHNTRPVRIAYYYGIHGRCTDKYIEIPVAFLLNMALLGTLRGVRELPEPYREVCEKEYNYLEKQYNLACTIDD